MLVGCKYVCCLGPCVMETEIIPLDMRGKVFLNLILEESDGVRGD